MQDREKGGRSTGRKTEGTRTGYPPGSWSFLYIQASDIAGSATKYLLEDWIDLRFRCAAQGRAKDAALAVAACASEGRRCKVPGGTPEFLDVGRNDIHQADALEPSHGRLHTARTTHV